MHILIIHGPNLNLLGTREPDVYGVLTLDSLNKKIMSYCKKRKMTCEIVQSNHEGEIVELIQSKASSFSGLIINPAAFTHTSVAIRDAISATNIATIEVHLSNVYARESFRHHSYIAPVCIGQISGFKDQSYCLAIDALKNHFS